MKNGKILVLDELAKSISKAESENKIVVKEIY